MSIAEAASPITPKTVVGTWLPLALSWIIMTSELVIAAAFVARMASPELNLAAWGIVFAISVTIQATAQTLLPTGAALASDAAAYARLRKYAMRLLLALTGVQLLVAVTPLYDVVMRGIGAQQEIVDIARLGVLLMVPYAFGTGFRRFQQGVLIRYGDARVVVWGSALRILCLTLVLTLSALTGAVSGVVAASAAVIVGVLAEALFTQVKVVPVLAGPLQRQSVGAAMTFGRFARFVWPLMVMTVLTMLVQSFVSVALARLPLSLESLAVWPVLWGFLMLWQSPGMAFTEVVISLVRRPGATALLRRFALWSAAAFTLTLLAVAATPLARVWFMTVSGLQPELAELAGHALWFGALLPGLRILISWFQGVIMYSEQTRSIMESILIFLAVGVAGLYLGGTFTRVAGIYVGIVAFSLAFVAQAVWLRHRSRPLLRAGLRRGVAR
ncbi:MAG: hypothetical protein KF875_12315 [Trueperaceae bacterium]|nr:hypothetical protein [Trueperaceae bacterium]